MAVTPVAGKTAKIYIVSTTTLADDTNTVIGGELNSSVTVNGATIDVSSKDSNWADYIAGQSSWEASGSFISDQGTSAEQENLYNALVAGTKVKIFIGTLSTTRTYGVMGSALVTSVSESFDNAGVSTKDISFQGCGEPTRV